VVPRLATLVEMTEVETDFPHKGIVKIRRVVPGNLFWPRKNMFILPHFKEEALPFEL
jgi:hypothetical protein